MKKFEQAVQRGPSEAVAWAGLGTSLVKLRRTAEGMRNATAAMPIATREQIESLERRIDELTRQVEALRSDGAPAGGELPPARPRIS